MSQAPNATPVATCSEDSPPHGFGAGGAGTEPRRSPPRIPRSNRPFHADAAMASAGITLAITENNDGTVQTLMEAASVSPELTG